MVTSLSSCGKLFFVEFSEFKKWQKCNRHILPEIYSKVAWNQEGQGRDFQVVSCFYKHKISVRLLNFDKILVYHYDPTNLSIFNLKIRKRSFRYDEVSERRIGSGHFC